MYNIRFYRDEAGLVLVQVKVERGVELKSFPICTLPHGV